jgi:F0F1-type ATP synthase membrane subunit b/b'
MSNEIYTKLDRLTPTEKMADTKNRVVRQEFPQGKQGKKHGQELNADEESEREEVEDQLNDPHCGKILDIVI